MILFGNSQIFYKKLKTNKLQVPNVNFTELSLGP